MSHSQHDSYSFEAPNFDHIPSSQGGHPGSLLELPPTENRLDRKEKSRLLKTSKKLNKVLGTVPYGIETHPPKATWTTSKLPLPGGFVPPLPPSRPVSPADSTRAVVSLFHSDEDDDGRGGSGEIKPPQERATGIHKTLVPPQSYGHNNSASSSMTSLVTTYSSAIESRSTSRTSSLRSFVDHLDARPRDRTSFESFLPDVDEDAPKTPEADDPTIVLRPFPSSNRHLHPTPVLHIEVPPPSDEESDHRPSQLASRRKKLAPSRLVLTPSTAIPHTPRGGSPRSRTRPRSRSRNSTMSFLSVTSPTTPLTPMEVSEHERRRRRMSKLTRKLGDRPPAELVFGPTGTEPPSLLSPGFPFPSPSTAKVSKTPTKKDAPRRRPSTSHVVYSSPVENASASASTSSTPAILRPQRYDGRGRVAAGAFLFTGSNSARTRTVSATTRSIGSIPNSSRSPSPSPMHTRSTPGTAEPQSRPPSPAPLPSPIAFTPSTATSGKEKTPRAGRAPKHTTSAPDLKRKEAAKATNTLSPEDTPWRGDAPVVLAAFLPSVTRRERRQGWSGEWNQPDMLDVVNKLRNL